MEESKGIVLEHETLKQRRQQVAEEMMSTGRRSSARKDRHLV